MWTRALGAGKVARRQRVRNLAMPPMRRSPLLVLPLLALAACAHAPQRPAQPQILNSPLGSFVAPSGQTIVSAPPSAAPTPEADPAVASASASLPAADPAAPVDASGPTEAKALE